MKTAPFCEDEELLTGCVAHAIRAGLCALVLALALHGCGGSRRLPALSVGGPPGDTLRAARGVQVELPTWLHDHPDLEAGAVAEVNAANFPDGWRVQVSLPVWFDTENQRLVTGITYPSLRLSIVGFRRSQTDVVLLPSCPYEAANARCGCESGGPDVLTAPGSK